MRSRLLLSLTLCAGVAGCGSSGGSDGSGGNVSTSSGGSGSGGKSGSGTGSGGSASGGATGSGGVIGSGGSGGSASGGVVGSGGAGTGGAHASGGSGSGGSASGGVTSSGGSASGGAPGSGGAASGGAHGGATASGGAAGGASGGGTICGFASGVNVAWVQFAGDVPNPNLDAFNMLFKNVHDAGGRVIRWWFHTNGTVTPGYDSNDMAVKLPQSHVDGVKAILNAASMNGVAVNISLWSFDMMQDNAGATYTKNQKLLEVDANRQAYIDNYLTPLVTALKGTPGLYSYEIFNEPEGMSEKGWATHRTTQAFINKTVNWLAAAIHDADPATPVTNGAQTFDYCSAVSGKTNYYSDSSLRGAGGKQNGTLDFYEVHYYTANGVSNSPFKNPASYWGLDKKLVMGEFYTLATDGVNGDDTYTYLYTNGYNGAWAWQYESDDSTSMSTKWPAMKNAIQNVYTAHTADVGSCP